MWLVDQVTGDLAYALRRDLMTDQLNFDDLSWLDLWAYITAAPPGTAIHHARIEGWGIGDKIAAEALYELRKLGWRYTAVHFKGGKDMPFPEPIPYPGSAAAKPVGPTWETITADELISPRVRELLNGG
jgi:hypothetical protein